MSDKTIDQFLEAVDNKWEEYDDKLDNFLATLSPETPMMLLITLLVSKSADLAVRNKWRKNSFMHLADLTYDESKETFIDSKSLH